MGTRDFLFFGHRTSGKSTLARELSQRGWEVQDVDQIIEQRLGKTCAQIIAENEPFFRRTEVEITQALSLDTTTRPRIIVCGGGLETFPERPVGVWISRDGWEESASLERSRLRPEDSFEREVEWMKLTREPRYRHAADIRFHIPRGRTIARCADELEDLLRWLDGPSPTIASKTYMVLPKSEDLKRAEARVVRLGLAGLEVRSDCAEDARPSVPVLASLRTYTPDWLREFPNATWDIDIEFLDAAIISGIFELKPRRLVLSAHPDSVADFAHLKAARTRLPLAWREHSELKFAPKCTVEDALPLPNAETFIPQGKEMAWMRHVLCQTNTLNYLPLGLAEHHGGLASLPPLDLQDWLPFWGLDSTASYDALLGFPSIQSQGDWWHQRASQKEERKRGYLKIPCAPEMFAKTLSTLLKLGIQNLSITSPLKALAGDVCHSSDPLNTMRWDASNQTWEGIDTDATGMRAALQTSSTYCQNRPRHAVIVGSGAVTPAIKRVLTENQWSFDEVTGRSNEAIPAATLLINATGRGITRPHTAHVQLDLHYTAVEPSSAPVHLNGDVFFEAQAAEQRIFWFQGV